VPAHAPAERLARRGPSPDGVRHRFLLSPDSRRSAPDARLPALGFRHSVFLGAATRRHRERPLRPHA
ncbi:hypothetical protein, partial [Streptomyces anatolicus]|uniref:hypothetical protein n=1 Tax=Streptomyces anatolicus TaxID=2675858 RepID=UPI001CA4BCD5